MITYPLIQKRCLSKSIPLMVKKKKKKTLFKKQKQKGISSNLKKVIYKNPVANIRLNDERLNIFPLRLEQSKHLALLFNIILEIVVNATKEGTGRREEGEWRGEEGRRGKGHRSFSNLMLHVCVCVDTLIHISSCTQ